MSDKPPTKPEAKVFMRGRFPFCGGCSRPIQREDQWRCPYVGCRVWLRGTEES